MARTPEEIFEHKAIELAYTARKHRGDLVIRYNVIQYVCVYACIDPDEMAVCLLRAGFLIEYDDSSISRKQNEKHYNRVMDKYRKTIITSPEPARVALIEILSDIAAKIERIEC